MQTKEKLKRLRDAMATHNMAAYLVVSEDDHGSEYVGDHFKAREYLSGFTGSAGTLVVTPTQAALWTDGRYFLQAEAQLRDSGITLMKIGEEGVPTIPAYLHDCLQAGDALGFDGTTLTPTLARAISEACPDVSLCGDRDLLDDIWENRPPLSREPVWELPAELSGCTRKEKLARVRKAIADAKGNAMVIGALDEIAWLLNLRGNDVACTPVFLSFFLLTEREAVLFVHEEILSPALQNALAADGVSVAPYEGIYTSLAALPHVTRILLDERTANFRLRSSIPAEVTVLAQSSPITRMKAMKNETEVQNIRRAHLRDGIALTKFICYLKHHVGHEPMTELSAARKLEELRREQEGYIEPSFDPIIAYGAHGAVVHYEPTEKTDIPLEPHGLCLADTGGQYREGTTDVTRTIALGSLTQEEKEAYTRVLVGHLRLGAACFPYGMTGAGLDCLARGPLWEAGLDYNHGTGHGVGYLLSVHEGPQRIHWRISEKAFPAVLEEGMVVSNEPGLYLRDRFGIRHENLLLVTRAKKTPYAQFFRFEDLTLVPFDRDAILPEQMEKRDLDRLNAYHEKVYAALSPYLAGEELAFLADATHPIG